MTRVPVDADEGIEPDIDLGAEDAEGEPSQRRATPSSSVEVAVQREITYRHLIRAVTSIVTMILYMAFTLLRERESGVVVLDDKEPGPEDDWDEGA